MQEILLIGGGGHCKSVIDVIEQENKYKIVGIIDKKELIGTKVFGYEIIASDDELQPLSQQYHNVCITVGQIKSPKIRVKLFELCKSYGFSFPVVVSPRAYVSQYAQISEGTIIMHDAMVNAGTSIGKSCIINSRALVEHDCEISDNCHISTGVILNGGVKVESNCFVGSGAVTKEGIVIYENSFIKAGSVVK